ncbi:hypothetical protein WN51_01295 [Melipona quadrifasciata]|uniref:Chitin-binding type-2 domain-containing protein n=1 Tax=Melipona quadrifasciata TaxID=166423 RepID=A0A0N0BFS7_9HYME|nr:hypothetical protein WN51_01295 [Melipona quadrifasciata]
MYLYRGGNIGPFLTATGLVTLVLCNVHGSLEHEIPKRSFLSRRAIDGTRGRKFFDPEEEGAFDSYGSAGGQYDPYEEKTDLSDIRRNVPGDPVTNLIIYILFGSLVFLCNILSHCYYADEVAGCQVFHVCHDVLVSSFLCPIGSVFSQKLLTCDWWTKVDCSASNKYIDVNRDSYQQDDDEMIRKAYAMISLQSGTDVTKDGLVDPDRTGSIVDYQKGPGRILDYSQVDTTGNDLRTSFDYSAPASRDFFPPSYQLKGTRKPEASRSYQDKFYSSDKSGSPYQDSPIIRIQKINDPEFGGQRNKDFQNAYRRPNEFTNQFQPSYAPTVPTVTTTTRRFYSPTVPTMFRSSTLAYNKLDQVIDSSDYYFSRGRTNSFVTPPTPRVFASRGKEFAETDSRKSSRDDEYVKQESYDYDYENTDSEERTRDERPSERFQVRVLDDLNDLNRTRVGGSPLFEEVYGRFRDQNRDQDNFDSADDFEVRGSIGLGQALHQSYRGISVRQQNPVKVQTKVGDQFNSRGEEVRHTLAKPESEGKKEETTEQYQRDDEETNNSNRFLSTTTPSVIESTIKASTSSRESSISVNSSVANSEYSNENEKGSIDGVVGDFQASRSAEFLEPPLERTQSKFQIKVPDLFDESTLLIRYTAQHDVPYSSSTTELPSFEGADSDDYIDQPTSLDGIAAIMSNYRGTEISGDSSFQNHPGAVASTLVSSTGSWFSSSPRDRSNARIPAKDHSTGKAEGDAHLKLENDTQNEEKIGRIKLEFSADNVQSSKERWTRQFNKTWPFSAAESIDDESSVADEVKKKTSDESKDNKGAAEVSRALLRSSMPETLRHIEESIDRNNSPYQVTLTMNRDEELVPTGRDIISKLIARQGEETSSFSDEVHELEIIKSVEPEIRRTTESHTTTGNISDVRDESVLETNDTTDVDLTDTKRNSPNMVSLLQLMSELLKLDRVPRPFSLSDAQSSRSNARPQSPSVASLGTIAKDVNSNAEFGQDEATVPSQETTSTELNLETSATRSKEKILGQLEENFGEPLYREGKRSSLELSEKERSAEFQADGEKANAGKIISSTSSKVDVESTATTMANVTSTTESEKTVVKTEFVPSIGFSLDTDEGREEYVEAILGGLIEPQTVESAKEEAVLEEKSEKEAFSRKNETTRSVSGKI